MRVHQLGDKSLSHGELGAPVRKGMAEIGANVLPSIEENRDWLLVIPCQFATKEATHPVMGYKGASAKTRLGPNGIAGRACV